MKRRALERHLRRGGAVKLREGSKHTVWARGKRRAAVPRNREISYFLARSICSELGVGKPIGSR
ncbi:MAG: addiction module toxin, HicA family [Solirubrobacterales bacterium]|nr:addiction module toxin, HicA family [Solirubrobacterales bacterium]